MVSIYQVQSKCRLYFNIRDKCLLTSPLVLFLGRCRINVMRTKVKWHCHQKEHLSFELDWKHALKSLLRTCSKIFVWKHVLKPLFDTCSRICIWKNVLDSFLENMLKNLHFKTYPKIFTWNPALDNLREKMH